MSTWDTSGAIAQLVERETRFHKSYLGIVVDVQDPKSAGRVKATVPDLLWTEQERAPWCYPRQIHALSVPQVGEPVEIRFVAGDPSRPVYEGIPAELAGGVPASYGGPSSHVIFEDPAGGGRIIFEGGRLRMEGNVQVELNGSDDTLVLFNALVAAITSWVTTVLNLHVHVPAGGPVVPPMAAPSLGPAEATKAKSAP